MNGELPFSLQVGSVVLIHGFHPLGRNGWMDERLGIVIWCIDQYYGILVGNQIVEFGPDAYLHVARFFHFPSCKLNPCYCYS